MKKLILFVITIFFFGIISASTCPSGILPCEANLPFGTFKLNSIVNLNIQCQNSSYLNISTIFTNQNTYIYSDISTTKSRSNYNYLFINSSELNTYYVNYHCDLNGIDTPADSYFIVTATGSNLDSAKALTYILIFIISFLIFAGLLIAGIAIPVSNKADELTGYVLAVSNLKYFKLLCLAFAYLTLMFLAYFSWNVSYAYLDMDFMTSIFHFIFIALLSCLLPLFILGVYLTIANAIRDSKISDMLSKGLHVKDM
jgi:hypothetical protein